MELRKKKVELFFVGRGFLWSQKNYGRGDTGTLMLGCFVASSKVFQNERGGGT